jgi:hypothetical protein
MTDAYPTLSRREALQGLQASYPSLFPAMHVSGLELFAVQAGGAMEHGGVQAFFDHLEVAVEHKVLREYWPLVVSTTNAFLADAVTLGEQLVYNDGSANEMLLHTLRLKDTRLVALTDGRAEAVLKSQALRVTDREFPKTLNNALFEFTAEVIVARLLNFLVTAYPHTVTPHFTTFLGCFRQNVRILGTKGGERVFAMYERAHISLQRQLEQEFRAGTACPRRLGARLFAIIFSLAAASHIAGFSHNDLALRNIMERAVGGTVYAGAHWAYKLRDVPCYVIVPPEAHGDQMVEIIDFGRATLTNVEPDSPTSTNALRFVYDVGEMLADLVDLYHETAPRSRRGDPVNALVIAVAERIAAWPKRQQKDASVTLARAIYDKWHTDDAVAGLGFLFGAFFHMPAPPGVTPLVVAIAPSDNLLTVGREEPLVAELARIWHVAGAHRAYAPNRCRTCASPATHVTENGKHGFCGMDCYHVFYGQRKRKRDEEDEDDNVQKKKKKSRRDETLL